MDLSRQINELDVSKDYGEVETSSHTSHDHENEKDEVFPSRDSVIRFGSCDGVPSAIETPPPQKRSMAHPSLPPRVRRFRSMGSIEERLSEAHTIPDDTDSSLGSSQPPSPSHANGEGSVVTPSFTPRVVQPMISVPGERVASPSMDGECRWAHHRRVPMTCPTYLVDAHGSASYDPLSLTNIQRRQYRESQRQRSAGIERRRSITFPDDIFVPLL